MSRKYNTEDSLFRIPPYSYIHVLDQNTNVTKLEVGPKTYIRQDNERVIYGPEKMITVPPRSYIVIENPVIRDSEGNVVVDQYGQIKLLHADTQVRFAQEPFPLYPGEKVKLPITSLQAVKANTALRLRAELDFVDEDGQKKIAGDEWLFEGPGTYMPRKEVIVEEVVQAIIISKNHAVKLRARKEMTDRQGNPRVTGEMWLVNKVGAYLPEVYEEVIELVKAVVLTEKVALHMRAVQTFTDFKGVKRRNGEEWLITMADTESHIPEVFEESLGIIAVTTLTSRQYCIVLDPIDDKTGKNQLGSKTVIRGETSFFLRPGEKLEKGIQDVYVLGEDEGLILKAKEECVDEQGAPRKPGDKWKIRGPCDYVPTVSVEVFAKRKAISLDENEGIYVRNMKTGQVRSICGETYMLSQDEELWEKKLPEQVEKLLDSGLDPLADRGLLRAKAAGSGSPSNSGRDRTRVVTFRVSTNSCVQIYDYKEKKARVVFGPHLVMLGPDEQFTQLSLSGGKPKRANAIRALALLLGPDFCTDLITVETADHARLQLQLSYNWSFDTEKAKQDEAEAAKLFSIPDFVGDMCKAIASRIRGAVASTSFDDFHKNSSRIIRKSVFGVDERDKIQDKFVFDQNRLNVTSIDIQSVEPVDQRTREALLKSVQLAIEITTNSQEATARHEADRKEQEARGRLERQKITDEAAAERSRRDLLDLQAQSAAIESTGQAKAEASSRAEALRIEGEAEVEQARLKAEASSIRSKAELEQLTEARTAEIKFLMDQNEIEINKSKELSSIEVDKFEKMISAIGTETIKSIATAGPDHQVKLLRSLGIQSTIFTDGKSPINLFNAAQGLIGNATTSATSVFQGNLPNLEQSSQKD